MRKLYCTKGLLKESRRVLLALGRHVNWGVQKPTSAPVMTHCGAETHSPSFLLCYCSTAVRDPGVNVVQPCSRTSRQVYGPKVLSGAGDRVSPCGDSSVSRSKCVCNPLPKAEMHNHSFLFCYCTTHLVLQAPSGVHAWSRTSCGALRPKALGRAGDRVFFARTPSHSASPEPASEVLRSPVPRWHH